MSAKTVLVVEDNDLNMKLVRSLLKIAGVRGIEADNAELGLDLARRHRPDLILMDIELPGMDGLSAVGLIRQDPQIKATPVLALTAYAMEEERVRGEKAGFNGYLTKPIDIKAFQKSLAAFLGDAPAPASAEAKDQKGRILVVDDEPLNVKLLGSQLAAKGYEIASATSGAEALERVRNDPPDLILLDVMMPGIDGYEVTRRLKQDPQNRDIPIIMVTALDGVGDKEKGLSAGADEFLNKPINATELEARVLSLLRLRSYQQQLDTRRASERRIIGDTMGAPPVEEERIRPTVLIVEDDPATVRLIQGCLAPLACQVAVVPDGEAALAAVARRKIDVVLLDVLLPVMDGYQVCRLLKQKDETFSVQVVMMTSLKDMPSKLKGIEVGADDYLIKPLNKDELRARVKSLLRKKAYFDRLRTRMDSALHAAITDELTRLHNFAYFKHFFELEFKRSRRHRHDLALLMIDVDDFKRFNDTHGHPAGDAYLKAMGQVLVRHLRETDLAARYGGEEFAVVLPYTGRQGAEDLAARLVAAVRTPEPPPSISGPLPTVSIGIGLIAHHGTSPEALIRAADEALYEVKRNGKNGYRVRTPDRPADAAATGRAAG